MPHGVAVARADIGAEKCPAGSGGADSAALLPFDSIYTVATVLWLHDPTLPGFKNMEASEYGSPASTNTRSHRSGCT